MSFVAGPYKWFVVQPGSPNVVLPLGVISEAPRFSERTLAEPIPADAAGGMPADFLSMGKMTTLDIVFSEYDNAGVQELFKTAGGGLGLVSGIACPMVKTYSRIVYATKLGACAAPTTFIARAAAVAPGFSIEFFMGSRLRNVPLKLQLFPYEYTIGTGVIQNFEWQTVGSAPYLPSNHNSYTSHKLLADFLAA